MIDHDLVRARLRKDEGYKTVIYIDTRGNATGGIGHKCVPADNVAEGDTVTPDRIEAWFDADYLAAGTAAEKYPWFDSLNDARQQLIVCLEFNMGPHVFGEFHETQAHLVSGDYAAAADSLLDSAWANEVDPHGTTPGSRGGTYARILRTGVWE